MAKKGWFVLIGAHIVCCGVIILFVLAGSAGITAIFSLFQDPLVQAGFVVVGAIFLAVIWKRRTAKHSGILHKDVPS